MVRAFIGRGEGKINFIGGFGDMNEYHVFCNEKSGYWIVSANSEKEAIYECTKGYECYTGVFAIMQ